MSKVLFLTIFLAFLLNNCASDTYKNDNSITIKDCNAIKEELAMLNLNNIDSTFYRVKYKAIFQSTENQKIKYEIYAAEILPEKLNILNVILAQQRMLVPMPISENILFKFKIDDKSEFDINNLYKFIEKEPQCVVNDLDTSNIQINRMSGYYYFQDLIVYRNIQKSKRKRSECKFVIIDLKHSTLVIYKDQIKYN